MRYAMIMAGGSGTRLWPMSRARRPKQLIPFIHGQSLIEIAVQRLQGLIDPRRQYICAGADHRAAIQQALPRFDDARYLAEPVGRDTLNAVAFGAAVIARTDPKAVMAVFTADHMIEPRDRFQQIVATAYDLAEKHPDTLVTFGIAPTHAATGFGYLELGDAIEGAARVVSEFREKPDPATAQRYLEAGPQRYLWNSGMFVWRVGAFLNCLKRYQPETHEAMQQIAAAWGGPDQDRVVAEIYPQLKKISVDYAIMEPASKDPQVRVAALPMALTWLDVGSWPAFAKTCAKDEQGNALAADRHVLLDSRGCLAASSDPEHLIAAIGCEDLLIVHTPDATLVCRADQAEQIKQLQQTVAQRFGEELV
jgi:mannose-1-phosphate guanylyltransferase